MKEDRGFQAGGTLWIKAQREKSMARWRK